MSQYHRFFRSSSGPHSGPVSGVRRIRRLTRLILSATELDSSSRPDSEPSLRWGESPTRPTTSPALRLVRRDQRLQAPRAGRGTGQVRRTGLYPRRTSASWSSTPPTADTLKSRPRPSPGSWVARWRCTMRGQRWPTASAPWISVGRSWGSTSRSVRQGQLPTEPGEKLKISHQSHTGPEEWPGLPLGLRAVYDGAQCQRISSP